MTFQEAAEAYAEKSPPAAPDAMLRANTLLALAPKLDASAGSDEVEIARLDAWMKLVVPNRSRTT